MTTDTHPGETVHMFFTDQKTLIHVVNGFLTVLKLLLFARQYSQFLYSKVMVAL